MGSVMEFVGFEFTAGPIDPELSSAQRCFKYTLVVSNTIFFIFGCVLAAVGSYAIQSNTGILTGTSLPSGIIAIGVFIIILAFLGCFASWRESRTLLGFYFLVLLLLTIILFAVGIAVYTQRNDAESLITDGWSNAPPLLKRSIADAFGCCGFKTCIDDPDVICPETGPQQCKTACFPVLVDSFQHHLVQAGGCGIAFAILMFADLILVGILMKGIKQKRQIEQIKNLHRKIREAKEPETDIDEIIRQAHLRAEGGEKFSTNNSQNMLELDNIETSVVSREEKEDLNSSRSIHIDDDDEEVEISINNNNNNKNNNSNNNRNIVEEEEEEGEGESETAPEPEPVRSVKKSSSVPKKKSKKQRKPVQESDEEPDFS